jgi:hypothetical protein
VGGQELSDAGQGRVGIGGGLVEGTAYHRSEDRLGQFPDAGGLPDQCPTAFSRKCAGWTAPRW